MGCIGRYTTLCQNWSHRAFIEVFPFCRGDSKYSPLHLSPLGIQVILVFKTSSFKEYLWNEIPQQDMSKDKINNNSAISSTLYWWKKKSVSLTYPVCFGSLLPIYILSFLRGDNMCHNITSFAENFLNTWFCFILILSLSGTTILSVYKLLMENAWVLTVLVHLI